VKIFPHSQALFLLLALAPSLGLAGLNVFPASNSNNNHTQPPTNHNTNTTASSTPGFTQEDLDQAVNEAWNEAWHQAWHEAWHGARAECAADPENCDITLSSFLGNAEFGETEPNDHMLSANPLNFGVKYWGQSHSETDQDWFYITTLESNQIVTVLFNVPSLDEISGWNLSLRDKGGNILAEVNSGFDGTPDTLFQAALSHAGTYYIVVKPLPSIEHSSRAYSYNLAAFVESSKLTAEPIDVNFFDAEVEPNDTPEEANPLSSSVTMVGMLSAHFIEGTSGFFFEEDWFVYETDGNEILTIEFCARRDCEGGIWQVTVYDHSAERILTTFRTDKQKRVDLGIRNPGRYYVQITTAPKLGENGGVVYVCSDPAFEDLKDCPDERALVVEPVWQQYNFTVTGTKLPPLMGEVDTLP
jgi:hypothetical protein